MGEKFHLPLELFIFFLGLVSNSIGFITLVLSKKLKKIGTRSIYILLFIVDSLFLVITIVDRLSFNSGHDLTILSSLNCKMFPYLNRILATLSPMLLVCNLI